MDRHDEPPVYVFELMEKIKDHGCTAAWLSEKTGIERTKINAWIRVDGPTKNPKVPANAEERLAGALGGRAEWEEWRDRRPHLKPNSGGRRDAAAAFLARMQAEQVKGEVDSDGGNHDYRPYVLIKDVEIIAGGRHYISAALRLLEREDEGSPPPNSPAHREGDRIIVDIYVSVRPRRDDDDYGCEVGVSAIIVSTKVTDGSRGRFKANLPSDVVKGAKMPEGVEFDFDGTGDSMHAFFSSKDKAPLQLSAANSAPFHFGEFRQSRIDDSFVLTVHAPAEQFVISTRRSPKETGAPSVARLHRDKVTALLERWNLRIPTEPGDVEVFKKLYEIKRLEET